MITISRLLGKLRSTQRGDVLKVEAAHWNQVERKIATGKRLFWLNHPRIAYHYQRKGLIEGLPWREWLVRRWGGPADLALELGCGNGAALSELVRSGVAKAGVGYDLDASRFAASANRADGSCRFIAADLNRIELEENRYDLIYALQSFHHFAELDHIMAQVHRALTPLGYFVLDEFVGPARFQWTDVQLTVIAQLLSLLPRHLRLDGNGVEKLAEGLSAPEEVIRVCPSEAIRSDQIIPAFYRNFDVVQDKKLGGTVQHLLYSGIVQNFPDNDPQVDQLIDGINGIESTMIANGMLPSDFALLIGRKRVPGSNRLHAATSADSQDPGSRSTSAPPPGLGHPLSEPGTHSELDPGTHLAAADDDRDQLRERYDMAMNRLADVELKLQECRAMTQTFRAGLERYEEEFSKAVSVLRSQRAWRVMIALREAYGLWTRRGWHGKLRSLPVFLWTALADQESRGEHEVQFPSVRRFVPYLPEGSFAVSNGTDSLTTFPRKYDILVLGIIDFDVRFQRPQQLAAQFARDGHRVFWVSPTRFVAPTSKTPYLLRGLRKNIWEVQLRGPQPDVYRSEMGPESSNSFVHSLSCLCRELAISEKTILVQLPFWRRVALGLRQERGGILVYDCMDERDSFENIGDFNRHEERALVTECDLLTVTAQTLVDKFAARGVRSLLVPNAVDYDLFIEAPESDVLPGVTHPIVGYFGAVADWFDLDLLLAVARARPQYLFVLAGQVFGRDTSSLTALPNVRFLGHRPSEQVPALLRRFDVCMIPFLPNEVTAAAGPVKLYEYFSLGKAVVTTNMAELHQGRDLVYLAETPEQFVDCLDSALREHDSELRDRRIEFARRNTWSMRTAVMDAAVCSKFPLISILVVTHNSDRYILPCLESILRNDSYPNVEIIVVDNASTDVTADMVRSFSDRSPRFRYELLDSNRGFAAGNNLAAQLSQGEYLAFLNPDTVVTPGWLGRLLSHLNREPGIGLVGPVTNFAGNWARIPVDYYNERSMEAFSTTRAVQYCDQYTEVEMVALFCALMSRSLFLELGGLDERYTLGLFEDDDLAARVRARGRRIRVAEDCFVHHFGQAAFGKLPHAAYNELFEKNRRLFEQKWRAPWIQHRVRTGVTDPVQDFRFEPEGFCQE
jgi:GT2 family glycosyltransferase/SAM-dependent methyltransferase/glycosyltransferase involved in cell wall biosynthesis